MWLYEHLPPKFKAWEIKAEAAALLNVSPERAEQYLRMLQTFKLIWTDGWDFYKVDKNQKKLKMSELTEAQKDE